MADLTTPIIEPIGAYSAYAIAVKHGFVGTEEEWLLSLRYDHSEEFMDLAEQVRQDVVLAEAAKEQASASATAASLSEDKAKGYATNAYNSESNAASSAGAALASANAAEASKNTAEGAKSEAEAARDATVASAGAAEQSKNAAQQSAVEAANAAEIAQGSEASAAQSAALAQSSAEAAAASESNATNSATSASQSASSASASAQTAQTSASAAANSAVQASSSANDAADSADVATEAKTQASASASTAQNAATNASQSSQNAVSAAESASSYSSAAQQSATSAASSADEAASKATEAAQSASSAANSETAATTSASQASESAQAAEQSKTAAATSASQAAESAEASAQSETAAAASAAEAAESAAQAEDAIATAMGILDDEAVAKDSTWSSAKLVDWQLLKRTASGDIVHLENCYGGAPLDVTVEIVPTQEGTGDPSPENVRPIVGWDSVNIWRGRKNLLDISNMKTKTANGITFQLENGGIHVSGTATGNADSPIFEMFLPAGTYICDLKGTSVSWLSGSSFVVQRPDGSRYYYSAGASFTIKEDEKPLYWCFVVKAGATVDEIIYPQLELGSTATAYEPYRGETFTIDLGQTVYGGRYSSDGNLVLTHKHFSLPISAMNNSEDFPGWSKVDGLEECIVSNWDGIASGAIINCTKNILANTRDANKILYRSSTLWGMTQSDLKATYPDLVCEIVMPLLTPVTVPLDTLNILALSGTNTLYADAGPVTVNYHTNTPKIINDSATSDTTTWSSEKIEARIQRYRTIHQWGVEIPATSGPECKRLYDAEGMTAAAHLGSYDPELKNDFDDVFLMKARGERINYDIANRKILAIEGDSNFKLDGTNGDVFVRQIAHWHKREILPDGREIRAIADGPVQGYEYVPERLIPCYLASAADVGSENNDGTGTLRSISGARPLTQVSLQNFYTKAQNTGCTLMDMDTWADQADMMLIEFATRNMQAAIGNGFSSGTYTNTHTALVAESDTNRVVLTTAQANLYIIGQRISISSAVYGTDIASFRKVMSIETYDADQGWSAINFDGDPVTITIGNYVTGNMLDCGGTNDIIIGSGYIGTNGKAQVKYRGVEDVYGNVFQGLLGVLKVGTHPPIYHYCDKPDYYGFEINDNWREIARRTDGDPEGYVKEVFGDMTAPLATSLIAKTTTGASSATYWCDYYYRSAIPEVPEPSRVRVPFFGGYWGDGSGCGPWYGVWACAPSTSLWNYGARPLVIPPWGVRGA